MLAWYPRLWQVLLAWAIVIGIAALFYFVPVARLADGLSN
jgi:hypothetical protein